MPKHVEMVWTKCQPKNWTDKMQTTKKVWTKCQPLPATKLGLFIWQNPLDSKTHRGFHGKTHGTIQGSIIWQNPLDGKSHWGIHGKSHGTKIINLNFGWQQRQYTFRGAIMIFWRLIHISLWISLEKYGCFGKMCVFQGEHSENLSEITENEEIFGLDDKIIGVGFFFATFPIRFCISGPNGM